MKPTKPIDRRFLVDRLKWRYATKQYVRYEPAG